MADSATAPVDPDYKLLFNALKTVLKDKTEEYIQQLKPKTFQYSSSISALKFFQEYKTEQNHIHPSYSLIIGLIANKTHWTTCYDEWEKIVKAEWNLDRLLEDLNRDEKELRNELKQEGLSDGAADEIIALLKSQSNQLLPFKENSASKQTHSDDSQTEFKKRALKIILSKKFKDYCDLVKDVWEHLHKQKLISYSLFDSKSIESVFKQIAGIMLYMELQCHNFPLVQRLNSLIFGTKGVGKTYMLKSFYEVTHLISDSIIPIYVDYSRSKETPFELILKRVFQLQILNEEEFNDLDDALIKLSQLNKYIMFFADEIQVLFNSLSDLKYQEIIIQLVQIGKSAGHSGILSGDSYKVQSLAFNPPPGYGRCDLNDTVYLPILLHPIRSFDEIKGLIKSRYPYDITDEFVNETFNITGGIGRNIDDFLRSQTQIKSNSKFASLLLESAHHSNLLRIAAAIFNSNTINQSKFDIWNQGTISKIDFDSSIDLDNYVYLNILWAKDSIGLFTKKYELLFPCDFEIIKSLMQTSNPNYLDVALAICYDQDGTMNLSAHKANIYIEYHVRKRIIGYPNSKFNGFYTNGNTFSENLIRINSSSILGAKNLNKQFCTWSKEWSFDGLGFDIEHKTVKVHYLQVKTRKHQNEIDDKYLEYEVFSKVKKGFSKIKSSMMKYKCKRPKSQKSQQNDQEELIFNGYTIVLSSLTLVTSAAQVIGAPDKISVDGVECEFKVICGKEFYVLIGPNQFYENQLQTSAYYSY